MPRPTNKPGFTLIEIVVSITILAMMALMLARVFTETSKAIGQGSGQSTLDETARLLLDNIETDVSQALVRTNIPFRVSTVSVGDALYCVSPAVHRRQETNPRDTAPIQFRSKQRLELVQSLNRRAIFEYASGATVQSNTGRKNLIQQSNTYRAEKIALRGEAEYTTPLEDLNGVVEHASLTFMDFRINGDSNSNRDGDALPATTDMPRFVDVAIGLVSAADMRQAMRLDTAQGADTALDFLERRERIYTRRVFMPNTGLTRITLQ